MKLVQSFTEEELHAAEAAEARVGAGARPSRAATSDAYTAAVADDLDDATPAARRLSPQVPFASGSVEGGAARTRVLPEPPRDPEALARQAAMILSAMDAAARTPAKPFAAQYDRRRPEQLRFHWRKLAHLKLYADPADTEPWVLFTRDANPRALGFVTPDRLPLGYGGVLSLDDPTGARRELEITLIRCRECVGGWYEGALYFNRTQPQFGPGLDEWA